MGEEADEIRDGFERYDPEGQEEIETYDVGKVLRWLGYVVPWDAQQKIVADMDRDGSGSIDLSELRKGVRGMREYEMDEIINEIDKYKQLKEGRQLSKKECLKALQNLGCSDALLRTPEYSSGKFNRERLMEVAIRSRAEERRKFKTNAGFSPAEVEMLRAVFKTYDTEGTEAVSCSDLRNLLVDLFPDIATTAEGRPRLIEIMNEADADGSGTIDETEFIHMVGQCRESEERDSYFKEQNAIKACGLSPTEVEDFRSLYMGGGWGFDRNGLDVLQLEKMLRPICRMSEKDKSELKLIFASVCPNKLELEFAEFIIVMKKMIDADFCGLGNMATG